jgi:hypothetical protein
MAIAIRISATDSASPTINKVTREVAGLGTTAEKAEGGVGGLSSALGKLGLAGLGIQTVVGAVAGLGKALVDPIMAASDLEESINKVQVVFGDSSKVITDFAKTSAQSLGQSQAAALGATGTFGNLFVSMGLGQKDAAALSTRIVTLGSDLASFNNIKPEEALEKLRAGLVGESEPLRALGVNLNEAAVAEEALRLGLGKSAQTLTDSAKIQARYSLILQQTKSAQGDFARTSTGMANALRIISASFADLRTQIGNRFLPIIAPLISQVAVALPRAMDALAPVLDRAGAAFASVAQTVGRFVTNLREQGLVSALRGLGGEIGTALLAGLQSVRDFAGGVVSWLRGQIASIDWGQVWSAATGLASGLVRGLGDIVGMVTAWVSTQWAMIDWNAVWKTVQGHGAALVASLEPISEDVTRWLGVQFHGVDWDQVWTLGQAGLRMPRALIAIIDAADTGPLGEAIGRYLVRAIKAAITLATGPDGGFAGGAVLMAGAYIREMVDFPGLVLGRLRGLFVRLMQDALAGAARELELGAFTSALSSAITRAVSAVFPIKVGPLTIGLGGVSLNVTGITNAAGAAAGAVGVGGGATGGGGAPPAMQHGGLFRVAGSGGVDSRLVSFRATPGEVVAVGHPRSGAGGGAVVLNVANTFHVANRAEAEHLADVLPDALARALAQARSQQGLPTLSGLVRFA